MVRLFTALKNQGASDPAAGVGDAFGEEQDRQERAEKLRMEAEAQEFNMAATLETQRINQEGLNLQLAERIDRNLQFSETLRFKEDEAEDNRAESLRKEGAQVTENKRAEEAQAGENRLQEQAQRDLYSTKKEVDKRRVAARFEGANSSNAAFGLQILGLSPTGGPSGADREEKLGVLTDSLANIAAAQDNDTDPEVVDEMLRTHAALRVRTEKELTDLTNQAIAESNQRALDMEEENLLEQGVPQSVIDFAVTGNPNTVPQQLLALTELGGQHATFQSLAAQLKSLADPDSQNPNAEIYKKYEEAKKDKPADRNAAQSIYVESSKIAVDAGKSYVERAAAVTNMLSLVNGGEGTSSMIEGLSEAVRVQAAGRAAGEDKYQLHQIWSRAVGSGGSLDLDGPLTGGLIRFVGMGLGITDERNPLPEEVEMREMALTFGGAMPAELRSKPGGNPIPNASAQGSVDLYATWSSAIMDEMRAGKFSEDQLETFGRYLYEVSKTSEWEKANSL